MDRQQIVEQRVSDFKHSFQSGPGARTYKHLSQFCLEHENTYVPDSDKSIWNAGAREVILEIRRWLDYDLSKFRKEQNE